MEDHAEVLAWFVTVMKRQLALNPDKNSWRTMDLQALMLCMMEEKLMLKIETVGPIDRERAERVMAAAAVVANRAMMIADVARLAGMPR